MIRGKLPRTAGAILWGLLRGSVKLIDWLIKRFDRLLDLTLLFWLFGLDTRFFPVWVWTETNPFPHPPRHRDMHSYYSWPPPRDLVSGLPSLKLYLTWLLNRLKPKREESSSNVPVSGASYWFWGEYPKLWTTTFKIGYQIRLITKWFWCRVWWMKKSIPEKLEGRHPKHYTSQAPTNLWVINWLKLGVTRSAYR